MIKFVASDWLLLFGVGQRFVVVVAPERTSVAANP